MCTWAGRGGGASGSVAWTTGFDSSACEVGWVAGRDDFWSGECLREFSSDFNVDLLLSIGDAVRELGRPMRGELRRATAVAMSRYGKIEGDDAELRA